MDMVNLVQYISEKDVPKAEKIQLLKELILDCYLDMEAQEENMNPRVKHNNAEAYRLAKDLVRDLESEE